MTKIYVGGLWSLCLITAMGIVFFIFMRVDGLSVLWGSSASKMEEPSQLLMVDWDLRISSFNNELLADFTMKANRTKDNVEITQEQMCIYDSKTWNNTKILTALAVQNLSRQNFESKKLLGLPVLKPKFIMNRGDTNSNKYFQKNRDGLHAHIQQAIDAGCMNGWNHKQTVFIQFGEFPDARTIKSWENHFLIWYQMEQWSSNMTRRPKFTRAIKHADHIWDFSYFNLKTLSKKHEAEERYFFVPFWTTLHKSFFHDHVVNEWNWDVLLFGSLNPRRRAVCQELKERNLRVSCGNFWNRKLEHSMRLSRLLLNVHFYVPAALEVHRINPALADGMVVVSEKSWDTRLDDTYSDVVTFAPLEDLVNTVIAVLKLSPEVLAAKRISNRKWIQRRSCGVDPNLCFVLTQVVESANKKFSG